MKCISILVKYAKHSNVMMELSTHYMRDALVCSVCCLIVYRVYHWLRLLNTCAVIQVGHYITRNGVSQA